MSFISKLFNKYENQASGQSQDDLLTALLSGEAITKEQALAIPAVSSAVDRISNTVAMLPVYLYKQSETDESKQITKLTDDRRPFLLNCDTGDTLDSFELKKALVQDYLLDKGGYAYIKKSGNNYQSLHYLAPDKISYIKNNNPIFKTAVYTVEGKSYQLHNFLTLLRSSKDGITGNGLVAEIQKALDTAYQNILFELKLVKKGGAKKGFLTSEKAVSEEKMKALKLRWNELYNNPNENTMVLGDGLKFQEASNSSSELQLNERKKTLNDEINSIFHISSDYNQTIKEAIMPIVKAFETALNKKLLLEKEKPDHYFAFDTREITKGSIKERYEAYKLAKETGFITGNEIRYLEDLDQIDGLDTISFSLAQVLYDTKTKKYYVPNTGATFSSLDEVKNDKKGVKNE